MHTPRSTIIIGAVVAVICQIVVAPNIEIFQAMPSFIIVYTLVIAMLVPEDSVFILAFVLGLVSDLLGYGPVGALPFILIVASFVSSRVHAYMDNGTVFSALMILFVGFLLVELLYAVFVMALGSSASPIEALLYRGVPCALYDCVLGLLLYPLMSHFIERSQTMVQSITPGPRGR